MHDSGNECNRNSTVLRSAARMSRFVCVCPTVGQRAPSGALTVCRWSRTLMHAKWRCWLLRLSILRRARRPAKRGSVWTLNRCASVHCACVQRVAHVFYMYVIAIEIRLRSCRPMFGQIFEHLYTRGAAEQNSAALCMHALRNTLHNVASRAHARAPPSRMRVFPPKAQCLDLACTCGSTLCIRATHVICHVQRVFVLVLSLPRALTFIQPVL